MNSELIPSASDNALWRKTGRTLDYVGADDQKRKACSLYLSIMDRMGIKLDRFGDADTRLERL